MKLIKNINWKKIMLVLLWTVLGAGTITIMAYAFNQKKNAICTGIEIDIQGASTNFFVDKQDITSIIKKYASENIIGKPINQFKIQKMESELLKEVWLNKAVIYFDNKGILKVNVHEREPLARIFTVDGKSFYIDETIKILPLSPKHTARLPVFTNYPLLQSNPTKADTALLSSISAMSSHIVKDAFLMSMIDQIDIDKKGDFELIPKLGDQMVVFGDSTDMFNKFEKFKLFYSKVIPIQGWSKYNKIDLQFRNQVVASIRGKQDIIADSLRTLQIMKTLAAFSSKMASDTLRNHSKLNEIEDNDISLILQSFSREDSSDEEPILLPKTTEADASKSNSPKAIQAVNKIDNTKGVKTNNSSSATQNKSKPTKKP
jgi:cell division protein FtsQ